MPVSGQAEQDLLTEARKNRDKAEDHVRENNLEAEEDLRFVVGGERQWHEEDLQNRRDDNRPALTINRMPQFIRQVTGDIRLNSPSIKVRPVDSGADIPLAKTFTGLIRNIEYQSQAMQAYINAAESAARCGIGHFRIDTEFSTDSSFELDIRIRRINNPFAVLWDPSAQMYDRSDANWVFVLEEVDLDSFKARWPDASTSGWETEQGDYTVSLWRTRDTVTTAEYWRKEQATKTLAQLKTGEVIDVTDLTITDGVIQTEAGPVRMTRTRAVKSHNVVQYLITDQEILEGPSPWVGKHLPIIPVLGEEIQLRNETVRHGIIRHAKDPQRQYNYWQTHATETMALAPKSPYLATDVQIEGHEAEWQSANRKNFSVLTYKSDPNIPGPPIRNPPPDLPVAAVNLMSVSAQDMHATTGIYPASLGAQGNETSGKAISLRQGEGDVGTFVYVQNLSYSIEHAGRILVDIIPKIYDTERIVRILDEDDTEEVVTLNQPGFDKNGKPVLLNDITVGRYDVVVKTGPSFSTKRAETTATMREIIQSYPQIMQIAGDLLFKAMDVPGADKIAERLEAAMQPPPPDPKAQADAMKSAAGAQKSIADAEKARAEAEGQQLENMTLQLQLAAQAGILQQIIGPLIQEQLMIALEPPQQPLTPGVN